MGELALYLLKSMVVNTIFLAIYLLFLKEQTFFRFNRYFLLIGLLLSVLLPLYTYTHQVTLMVTEIPPPKPLTAIAANTIFFWPRLLAGCYGIGTVFFVLRYLLGLVKINRIIRRSGFTQFAGYRLVGNEELGSSFSAFNYIFISTSAEFSQIDRQLILEHEIAHVRQCHWADLLLSQLFCTLQWFNPLAWMYRKAVRENHEYLADRAVLQHGTAPAVYRAVLVNQCIGTQVFSFSSSFHQYNMPRLSMMSRPKSAPINKAAVLIILPAITLFFMAFPRTLVTMKSGPGKITASRTAPAKLHANDLPITEKTTTKGVNPLKKRSSRPQTPTASQIGPPPAPVEASVLANPAQVGDITPPPPLILLDGVETRYQDIDQGTIGEVRALKDQEAIKAFGERGRNGVMLFYTKGYSRIP